MTDRSFPQGARDLDFDQPVVNIGSHPDNDAVLSSAGVLPFHAMLMVEGQEFRLVTLAPDAYVLVDGVPVEETTAALRENQRLQIGGHDVVVRHNGTPTSLHLVITERDAPAGVVIPAAAGEDNPILLNVLSRQAEVEVERSAVYQVEVVNAGPIVAGFYLSVQGVPEEWVQISPRMVNLNESQRAYIQVTITPPRAPTSTAGNHPLALVITSPNYPGQHSTVHADLTILPYYEFSLGSLSPRQQNIPWRRRTGRVLLPVTNQGNSAADFNVMAMDDENGCSFDFQINENTLLNRQALINIPAGATVDLPIEITPLKQPVIALRSRRYHYTATVSVAEQAVSPQIISGAVTAAPLLGWLSMLLIALLLAAGLFYLLQPRISYFRASANKDVIELGDSTRLEWQVSPFASRLSISGIDQPITRGQKHITIAPAASTTYELLAGNWLSGMMGLDQRRTATILVVPPSPRINVFEVDRAQVDEGEPVTVRWSITRADRVFLTIDEVVYELPPEQWSGEQSVVLQKDALITLEAQNASGSELRSIFVRVVPPQIDIRTFTVWVRPKTAAAVALAPSGSGKLASPSRQDADFTEEFVKLVEDVNADLGYRVEFVQPDRELAKGEQVLLEWHIEGVDTVNIAPFTETLPNKGKQPFFPQESMNFVLTAKSGNLERLYMLPVKVFDGQPPQPPKIEFFKATPLKAVGPVDVQFAWSVTGAWTRVEIATEGEVVARGLFAQGFKTLRVLKSTTFILTAWNNDLSSAAPLEITIDPTLLPVELEVLEVLPADRDRFMIGDSVTVQVGFGALPADKPKPTGTVIVTDGVATCTITLPSTACDLVFKSAGNPVQISASYQGDTIYLQADSDPFTGRILTVTSAVAALTPTYYRLAPPSTRGALIPSISGSPLALDEGLFVRMEVKAVGAVIPVDTKGQITLSICQRKSPSTYDPGSCEFYPTVATVSVDAATGTGTADIIIPNLPGAGSPVLLFEYRHADNAITPSSYSEYGVTVVPMQIALGLSICTNPTNFSGCTTGVSDAANAVITFDINKALGNTPLPSSLPRPVASDFEVYEVDGSNNKVQDWSCQVVLATTPGGGVYRLQCSADLSGKNSVNVRFTYSNTTSKNYFMGSNPNVKYFSNPFGLTIKTGTVITLDMLALQGIRSGQLVQLTPPGVVKLSLADVARTPITNSTGQITLQGEAGLLGLRPGTSTGNCSIESTASIDTVTITAINSDCAIYFKKAGAFDVTVSFAGDANYNASSSTVTVTVAKQLDVTMTWKSSSNGTSFVPWNVASLVNGTNLFGRIEFGGPSSFSPASLQGQILSLKLTTTAGNCSVYNGSTTTNTTSNVTVDVPVQFLNNVAYADFRVSCNTAGAQVTLDGDIKANAHFAVAAAQVKTRTFFIVSQARGNIGITISFVRGADNTPLTGSIENLYMGEVYRVTANVGVLWADGWTGGTYPTINSAINYYLTTSVAINLPLSLRERVDWTRSSCESVAGARDLRIRMTTRQIHWNTGDLSGPGASDISISNLTPCTLVFLPGGEINQQVSAAFGYDAVTPNYGYPVSISTAYNTNGLFRQATTLSANPALSGTGYIGVPATYTITVVPTVSNPSNPPILVGGAFDDYFAVSLPQNCSVNLSNKQLLTSTTASFTITPTQACSGGSIGVLYKGNDYFRPSSEITSTAVNFSTQKPTTTALPTASPVTPTTFGQSVTFSTTVTATGATPTGTVAFKNGATTLCSANLAGGAASCAPSSLPVGTYSVVASYTPNSTEFVASESAARTHVVNRALPTLTLASTPTVPTITVGGAITFTATLSGPNGAAPPTGTLTFTDTTTNAVLCASVALSAPTCGPLTSLGVGPHLVRVSYTGDTNYNPNTADLTVTVIKATPGISLTSTPALSVIFVGDSITFTATVSGAANVAAPTGAVTFTNGAATLCSNVALASGVATCGPFTNLAVGNHTISAAVASDANYNANSASLPLEVKKHLSLANTIEVENPANTWTNIPYTTSNPKAPKDTDIKMRVRVTDDDTPSHSTPIPTGQVEIWLVNNDGVALTGGTEYTITQVSGEGAVSYDTTAKTYRVTLNSQGQAVFQIRITNINNVTLRYRYLGDSAFERSPLSTVTPDYKVSTTFSVN